MNEKLQALLDSAEAAGRAAYADGEKRVLPAAVFAVGKAWQHGWDSANVDAVCPPRAEAPPKAQVGSCGWEGGRPWHYSPSQGCRVWDGPAPAAYLR